MPIAYIASGSNTTFRSQPPAMLLDTAADALSGYGQLLAQSSHYLTEPVGFADQPVFLNAVIALATELTPFELLEELLEIERRFGRDRSTATRNGPRTLDLDLLLYDTLILNSNNLVLPHPRLAERRFVLAPLAEIAPTLIHPVFAASIAQLLALLPQTGENRPEAVRRISVPM